MRFMNIAGLLLLSIMLLCTYGAAYAADESAEPEQQTEQGDNADHGAFAAPAGNTEPEPEPEKAQPEDDQAEDGGGEVAPALIDFGAQDADAVLEKSESEETEAVEEKRDVPAVSPAEEAKPTEAEEVKKEKEDFPKSPYPEMEGLSDRNFKLGSDEADNQEGEEARKKKSRSHTGFYLRLAPALAYMSYQGKGKATAENLDNPKAQGVAGMLDVFVGGAVAEDWILHAVMSIAAPFADVKGVDHRKQVNTIGIGLGFTHYLMPQNLYFNGNVSYAQTKMMKNSDGQVQGFDTSNGFKVSGAFGKEWWVADQFGLGVSGTMFYSWCRKDILTWNIYGAGAVFTLTYN